jgi:hypothetical protein
VKGPFLISRANLFSFLIGPTLEGKVGQVHVVCQVALVIGPTNFVGPLLIGQANVFYLIIGPT